MTHQRIDERSLHFGRLIADRLRDDPSLINAARENTRRWTVTASPGALPVLQEWTMVLNCPLDTVIHLLTSTDQRGTRLRQSNPFAGVLTFAERNVVMQKFY